MNLKDYRIPLTAFPKVFQDECKTCDHYYIKIKAPNGRFYRGHFCVRWGDSNFLREFDFRGTILESAKSEDACPFYRDRCNERNTLNGLRKNKQYLNTCYGEGI
jgi:hypothetical protein